MAGGSALKGNSGSARTHCEGLEQCYFYFLNLPISITLLRTGAALRHHSH